MLALGRRTAQLKLIAQDKQVQEPAHHFATGWIGLEHLDATKR